MTEVALIDAGGANLGSVRYALQRLGVEPRLSVRCPRTGGGCAGDSPRGRERT